MLSHIDNHEANRASGTLMYSEAASAADIVRRQIAENRVRVNRIGLRLRTNRPSVVVTCARGSSDHAATYGKYLIETALGIPVASFAPSVSSVYDVKPRLDGGLFIALSQSGKSPDLLASARAAQAAGARVLALVNVTSSPLADLADDVIPLCAGDERSVAATKSYIATLTALLHIVAEWTDSAELRHALQQLPRQLATAWQRDWESASRGLVDATNLFVIGRGLGLGIAQEAALKFKETTGLHAEAFSAAEVRHGPMAIVQRGFPVLVFTQNDCTRPGIDTVVDDFAARGAQVFVAGANYEGSVSLPTVDDAHPATAPVLFVQSFYRMVNALAVARGLDPDNPPHLRKVTETV